MSNQKARQKKISTPKDPSASRTVKLLIAFQGTRYEGWQSQRSGKTLQELFEKHLASILKEPVVLFSSSRTDSGVHARGMAAHFKTKTRLPDAKIQDALNYYLPKDVVVLSAKTAPSTFHARFQAKSKTYEYLIWNSRTRPVYDLAPFCLWVPAKLDLSKIRSCAAEFIGKHDFSAFRDSGEDEKDPVRTVYSMKILNQGNLIRIRIRGNGFLRHMIRVITGTLLEAGRGKLTPNDIKQILASKDRRQAGPTAKPDGLTLLKVQY